MKALAPALFSIVILTSLPAGAEVEKSAELCDVGICLHWWPKLPPLKGWHHELGASKEYGVNALAPDGYAFSNAEAVIYAKAAYKPRVPETKSLEMLISSDKAEFLANDASIVISEVDPVETGDGRSLPSFTFFPKGKGNWEQVSYGEEGDFYLVFTISSRTKAGFEKAIGSYKKLIGFYKEKPE